LKTTGTFRRKPGFLHCNDISEARILPHMWVSFTDGIRLGTATGRGSFTP